MIKNILSLLIVFATYIMARLSGASQGEALIVMMLMAIVSELYEIKYANCVDDAQHTEKEDGKDKLE